MSKLRDIWRVIRGDLSYRQLDDAKCELKRFWDTNERLLALNNRLGKIESAMARVVSKIDPMYATPEDDPQRKADSDRLEREVLQRLDAEEKARRLTGGAT